MRTTLTLSLLAAGALSQATLTVYTDRTAFLTATSGLGAVTTETFSTDRTLAVGDNLYNGVNYRIVGTVGGNGIAGGIFSGDEFTSTSLDFVFGSATRAFGADYTGANTASSLTFTIGGETVKLADSLPSPGTGFFGVVSSASFTTVDIGSGPPSNELYSFDNLTSVKAGVVPEPASLLALVLGGLAVLRRKKDKR